MLAVVAACIRGNDRLKICVHNRKLWAQILCQNSIMDDADQAVQTALGRRLRIIRSWHLREQVPLREIAKRLGISRNTVRRYLRSETTEPAYAERQSASAIDPYAFQLSGWLKTEAAKSRKQRRSLKQLHEDLSELGFGGSYDRVAAFARQWREGQTEWVNSARKRTH